MSVPDPAVTDWVPIYAGSTLPDRLANPTANETNDANLANQTGWWEIRGIDGSDYSGVGEKMPETGKWSMMVIRTEGTESGDTLRIFQLAYSPQNSRPIYHRGYGQGYWSSWAETNNPPPRLGPRTGDVISDLNSTSAFGHANESGWQETSSGVTNRPTGSTGVLVVRTVAYSSTYGIVQEVWELSTGRKWIRYKNSSQVWSSWVLDNLSVSSYGTALPTSPYDGQEFTLVDSLTVPTYQWRFRYNAGSSSAYKWEFIGGAPVLVLAAASSAVANTGGMTDAADSLPSFAVPRAGDYFISASAALSPTATGYFYMAVYNASTGGALFAQQRTYSAAGYWVQVSLQAIGTMVAAGQTIRLRFQAPTAGNVSDRSMSITPVRVS